MGMDSTLPPHKNVWSSKIVEIFLPGEGLEHKSRSAQKLYTPGPYAQKSPLLVVFAK